MEKKVTQLGNSYWNNNGAYQTEYDELYDKLVPLKGEAKTIDGEKVRAVSRLFYEFCNNGNCNLLLNDDDDDVIGIDDYYLGMIDFLYQYSINKTPILNLKSFLLSYGNMRYTFSDEEMKIYNDLVDNTLYEILSKKSIV